MFYKFIDISPQKIKDNFIQNVLQSYIHYALFSFSNCTLDLRAIWENLRMSSQEHTGTIILYSIDKTGPLLMTCFDCRLQAGVQGVGKEFKLIEKAVESSLSIDLSHPD